LDALIQSAEPQCATSFVGHADVSRIALEAQATVSADLIVVGKDGPAAIGNFLLCSVAQRLVSNARCDVLVIPRVALPAYQMRLGFAADRSRLASSPNCSPHVWVNADSREQEVAT
jgi:hypothetical protein